MSYLTDDERAAVQAMSTTSGGMRVRRAEALVNPASGLANDYLNLFNEIVMLVEQLPTMPEQFKAQGDHDLKVLATLCERAGLSIRESLDKATMLVNHGEVLSGDMVQKRTDLLLARLASTS